jgi:hypothetical protein
MAKMLNKASKIHQGRRFWYCCTGHDGRWKDRLKKEKGAQRSREKREWRKEIS